MFEIEYVEVLKAVKEAVWALPSEGARGQRLELSSQLYVDKCTIVKLRGQEEHLNLCIIHL